MSIGRWRDRITYQTRNVTNEAGVRKEAFVDSTPTRVPCCVETPFAQRVETMFGDRIRTEASHVITTRPRPGIKVKDRIVWHQSPTVDVVLEISGIQLVRDRTELVLAVTQKDGL